MRRAELLIAAILVLTAGVVTAQTVCHTSIVNAKGTSGASITVSNTAGGVTVADASKERCRLLIVNETANPARCAPSSGTGALTVSSTVGFYVSTGLPLDLTNEGGQAWKCIRQGGSDATLSVLEGMP